MAGRTTCAHQRMEWERPTVNMAIWKGEGGGGEREDDREGEERSTRRAGRVEERREGRRDVHYCSTVEGGVSQ